MRRELFNPQFKITFRSTVLAILQGEQIQKLNYADLRTSPRDRLYAMLAGISDSAAEAAMAPPM